MAIVGKKCLVIDKRPHIAGNAYSEEIERIQVHKYDPHVFHTNDTAVWKYLLRFTTFTRFTLGTIDNYNGEIYSLTFNMYTFNKMWGVRMSEAELDKLAKKVLFTSSLDGYFGYKLEHLEYRSVRFETETLDKPSFQRNVVVNYTDRAPFTRIIEHKWFTFGKDENGNNLPKTVISREYSAEWKPGDEPYYPAKDEKNSALCASYKALAEKEQNVILGGRFGEYKYYDMDQAVKEALEGANR